MQERYTISISRWYETDSGDNAVNISTVPWRVISAEEEDGILKRIEAVINRNMEEIIGVKQPTIPTQYYVSVGHIGTVWRGSDETEARETYERNFWTHHGSGYTVTLTTKRGDDITTLTNIDPSCLE